MQNLCPLEKLRVYLQTNLRLLRFSWFQDIIVETIHKMILGNHPKWRSGILQFPCKHKVSSLGFVAYLKGEFTCVFFLKCVFLVYQHPTAGDKLINP